MQKDLQLKVLSAILQFRFGLIPEETLSTEEYDRDLIQQLEKCISYTVDLISKTNSKTKKYKDYQKKLDNLMILKSEVTGV